MPGLFLKKSKLRRHQTVPQSNACLNFLRRVVVEVMCVFPEEKLSKLHTCSVGLGYHPLPGWSHSTPWFQWWLYKEDFQVCIFSHDHPWNSTHISYNATYNITIRISKLMVVQAVNEDLTHVCAGSAPSCPLWPHCLASSTTFTPVMLPRCSDRVLSATARPLDYI